MSGLTAKLGDRSQSSGKSKYLSHNINQTYSGKSALPARTSGTSLIPSFPHLPHLPRFSTSHLT